MSEGESDKPLRREISRLRTAVAILSVACTVSLLDLFSALPFGRKSLRISSSADVTLGGTSEGCGVAVSGSDGAQRVFLGELSGGRGVLLIQAANETCTLVARANEHGSIELDLMDRKERPRLRLGVGLDDEAFIEIRDAEGNPTWRVP